MPLVHDVRIKSVSRCAPAQQHRTRNNTLHTHAEYGVVFRGNMRNLISAGVIRSITTSAKVVPKARGLPLVGNLLALLRAGGAPYLHRYVDDQHRIHGPIFAEALAGGAVFIADPEAMRAVFAHEGRRPQHVLPEAWTLYGELYGCARGLFFMHGDEWLHHRRTMNNILLKANGTRCDYIQEAVETVASILDVRKWEDDLEEALYRWSLDTIVALLLGKHKYLECKSSIDEQISQVSARIKLIFETSSKLQLVPAKLAHRLGLKVWTDFVRSVDDALAFTSEFVYDLMNLPQSQTVGSIGVIQLMKEAQTAPSDIIKIVVDLVLAAGDTTAYTMEWILYLLARNPRYQEDLKPHQARNILRETLRMYPVAPFITRINAEQEIVIDNYHIPKSSLLIYSLFTVGRNQSIFNCPEQFMPERWENKTPLMMQASLPFAMGARSCIGRRIAELQLTTALVKVLKSYNVRLRNSEENIHMKMKMISVPSKPIKLEFIKRKCI